MSPSPETPLEAYEEALPPGTLLAGRFRIEALAGVGGMGKVYQAFDILLERFVALKSLLPKGKETTEHMEEFRQEALALAHLNHPSICQLYDLVITEHGPFLALEWVEGRTLDQAGKGMETRDLMSLLLQVAEGLEVAHDKGMIHRDLKPQNLMVNIDGRVKILDFGLARFTALDEDAPVSQADPMARKTIPVSALPVSDADLSTGFYSAVDDRLDVRSEKFTRVGFFMGSPRYASPEQIHGELAGTPSDIFSLGILMWELLLKEHPFPDEGKLRLKAVLENRRKPMRGNLPKPLAKLIETMLAPRPKDRPTACETVLVLRALVRPQRAGAWLTAGVAALTLLGFLGVLIFTRPSYKTLKASDLAAKQGLLLWTFERGNTEGWHGTGKWESSCSLTEEGPYVTEGRYALKLDCTGSVDWNQDIAINDGPFPENLHDLAHISVDVTAPETSLAGMEYQEIYLVFMGRTNKWYEIKRQFRPGKQMIIFDIDNSQIQQDVWHVYFVLNSSQPFKGPIYLDRIIGKLKSN